jgi:hypothetical protein
MPPATARSNKRGRAGTTRCGTVTSATVEERGDSTFALLMADTR